MPYTPPPLTPRRRELLARFCERFTQAEQTQIRGRAEARGIDFLELLNRNGDLAPRNPASRKKGNGNR